MANEFKIKTRNPELFLRVQKGHFATMHSHTNYYIDVTTQKMRLSEAKALAEELVASDCQAVEVGVGIICSRITDFDLLEVRRHGEISEADLQAGEISG